MYRPPKKKQLGQEAIPTTSLADMMFLLLIFFIMTTTLSRVTGFVTDMPAGAPSGPTQSNKTPTISLNEKRMLFNDREIDMARLRVALQALKLDQKSGEGKVVIVAATGKVKYQVYYEVLAMVSACGGVVAIITEEAGAGGKR